MTVKKKEFLRVLQKNNFLTASFLSLGALVFLSSCGYTSKTLLPESINTVHVAKVTNTIDITGDVTNRKSFQVYRPGVEIELRNAVIDRFVFDGHLKIAPEERADSVLTMELLEYRRDPMRYNPDESIQEFRINVLASVKFTDAKTGRVIWQTAGLAGNSDYFLSGPRATTEDQAVAAALEDLARHLVEEVLEIW